MDNLHMEHTNANIVVVDDIQENLHLLIAILQGGGYDVRPALNGRRALETVQAEPPDLILLDIMMPEMDGYEVCQHLKADAQTCDIPVIFISGLDGTVDKVKAFSVGAVDYITKPFQGAEVLARVNTHLTLQRQRKALEAANRDLQEFASVVSHDLKAPLRGINQIAQLLAKDYAQALDPAGKEMLGLLNKRACRMNELIEGILQYSRDGHLARREEQIDLNLLIDEVLETLAPPENIHIAVECELPVIIGDRIRLQQVFQNLLGNAVKYMDKPVGKIAINCVDEGAYWTFRIADNGPGIEPAEHENIFRMFRTAANREEQDSTGIGLAIVKKIVASYGGTIRVESTMGEGSAFLFTFPKRPTNV